MNSFLNYLLAVCLSIFFLSAVSPAHADALGHCDPDIPMSAAQQDRLLRFAALAKAQLQQTGARIALVSRSGLDLSRIGQRYSHAGITVLAHETPWTVRQLYFDCADNRPKIFDQGLSGFVSGTRDPNLGFLSLVILRGEAAASLEEAVSSDRLAVSILNPRYSANAYAFTTLLQNCNQWVIELIAQAWGGLLPKPQSANVTDNRLRAQQWLKDHRFHPSVVDVGNRFLMWLASLSPWIHDEGHPSQDLQQTRYQVTMPEAIERFVLQYSGAIERIEMCHTERHMLIRYSDSTVSSLAKDCQPSLTDTVIPFD